MKFKSNFESGTSSVFFCFGLKLIIIDTFQPSTEKSVLSY